MSPAFYKGKLANLVKIAEAEVLEKTVPHLKEICRENGGQSEVNIIKEISNMMTSILLRCAMGTDISCLQIDYWEDGKLQKRDLSYALRNSF